MLETVTVIGAGLAGSEAALTLADAGVKVRLVDCKPSTFSPAHSNADFCELVCSNSLKSNDPSTAHGLLKCELRMLKCHVLECAESTAVGAGSALAVDRDAFAAAVTARLRAHKCISIQCEIAKEPYDGITIIATGPLTLPPLSDFLAKKFGSLHFFDAAAPIVAAESIDLSCAFYAARYGKGCEEDYLNCPLSKDEYDRFYDALISAERADKHELERGELFEGCMPIEAMATRGKDAIRFGPMKPIGLTDPKTGKRAYAVLQLRRENAAGQMYNLVGFQTNLRFGEQKRVFSLIPALKNAEYLRYGVMHRNTFIDAPKVIDRFFRSKADQNIFVCGQLCGVEGYVESVGSGKCAALNVLRVISGQLPIELSSETILGALASYISSPNESFQPMNANYGLLPPLSEQIRDKAVKRQMLAERSLNQIKLFQERYYGT